ncbi:hypothetical protein L6164_010300 [Bauhinia variegata]|uniref:Uncharacterized protein n=1 Tax=Bauhinia variegata TaxID=167791 RepID=A0ACB9PMH4_BAUVA|nr:hypothetical protein L6164_010300 [Bauhinia variegata]
MAAIAGLSLSSPRILVKASLDSPQKAQAIKLPLINQGWPAMIGSGRIATIGPVRAAPDKISKKVEQSIKQAQEACSENPTSGECVAAWDEVEELSAAASHARDKQKDSDPLENYCKDNPETDECRTYDN